MILWVHKNGTSTLVDEDICDEDLLRVMEEALKTCKGQYPSVNSEDTIDEILDFIDEQSRRSL
jgi:hypothetical protein